MEIVMKYKDFLFPHNPRRLQVSRRAAAVSLHCPGLGGLTQHLGRGCRVVTGEGEFFGPGAGASLLALSLLAGENTAGWLSLPLAGISPFRAFLIRLDCLGEGDGRVLAYSFEFWEEEGGGEA